MRKCDIFKILISVYLDNELSKDEKEKLNEHLKECKGCQEEFKELKLTKNLFNFYERKKLENPYFAEKIINSVKKENKIRILKFGFAFAVLVIVFTGLYLKRIRSNLNYYKNGEIISYLLGYQEQEFDEEILNIYYGSI